VRCNALDLQVHSAGGWDAAMSLAALARQAITWRNMAHWK
jgi:hypothetical protein